MMMMVMMMVCADHMPVFEAVLIPAPLANGPWQAGFCSVLYVLRAVLTCCIQSVTDCVTVSQVPAWLLLCSL